MLPPIYLPTDADIVITAATDTYKMRRQLVFFPTLLHRSEIGSFLILRRPQRHGQLRRDLFNAPTVNARKRAPCSLSVAAQCFFLISPFLEPLSDSIQVDEI
jgi:hypothetical protein